MTNAHCLFCRIAAGEIPATRIHEDDTLIAFLDIGPIRAGHALIMPKQHHAYFDDLPPDLATGIVHLGQRIARAQKERYGVERVAFFFTGTDVAHVHAHVVPMVEKSDVTSRRYFVEEKVTFRPLPRETPEALAATATELRGLLGN